MAIQRVDERSELVDAINRFYLRDRGLINDTSIIWRSNDAATYTLDVDNNQGLHANFGGKALFTDASVTVTVPVLLPVGSVGAPSLSWEIDPDNGLYRIGTNDTAYAAGGVFLVGFKKDGSNRVQMLAADGVLAAPVWSYAADTDTGLYRAGDNDQVIVSGGVIVAEFKTTTSNPQVLLPVGAIGTPSLSFANDPDCGLYRIGTDDWAAVSGGVLVAEFKTTSSNPQILLPAGLVGTPSLALVNDPDTGLYRVGTDRLGVAVAGAALAEFSATGLGLGTVPSYRLHATVSSSGGRAAYIANTNSGNASDGLYVETTSTNAATKILGLFSNGTSRFGVWGDGAITGKGDVALQKTPLTGAAAGNLTLTNVFQSFGTPITASLTPGNWLVVGTFYFVNSGDTGQAAEGKLVVSGGTASIANSSALAVGTFETSVTSTTITRAWYVSVTATTTAEIQARKTGGPGSSVAFATHTTLEAIFLGNP